MLLAARRFAWLVIILLVAPAHGVAQTIPETNAFPEATARRIVVKDSKKNGALIGLVVGAVPGVALGLGIRTYCENEASRCPAAPVVTGAVFGAIGAGIGAGIDALIHKSINIPGLQRSHVMLSPVIGIERQGIVVSLRF